MNSSKEKKTNQKMLKNPSAALAAVGSFLTLFKTDGANMKITLITVGKIKEKYLRDAIGEYSKRLSKYCKLEIIEVADEKTPERASEVVEESIRSKEGERF